MCMTHSAKSLIDERFNGTVWGTVKCLNNHRTKEGGNMTDENLSNSVPASRVWTRYAYGTNTVIFGPQTTNGISHVTTSRYVIKGGLRKKPQGWLFPTPYSFEQLRLSLPFGRVEKKFPTGGYTDQYFGALYGILDAPGFSNMTPYGITANATPFPNVDHVSQAEVKALNGLLTHGKDRNGTFSAGVAWGERKETAELLRSTAQTCLDVLRDLRARKPLEAFRNLFPNGDPREWKKFKDTPYYQWYLKEQRKAGKKALALPAMVASGFLSLQNGWKPLLGDVHNATEALANRDQLRHWVITGKGFFKDSQTVINRREAVSGNPDTVANHEWVSTRSVFSRIDATVSDQFFHVLSQLGLTNPASLLWDLTPLTYVFDYFVAVGDWLRALEAAAGMRFYSGSVTRYGEFVQTLKSQGSETNRFSGSGRWVKWDRRVYGNFPLPIAPLSLKPKPLNLSQIGNMASLAYLYLTGHPPKDVRG